MEKIKSIKIKKNKLFWLIIVLGALIVLFGVTLLPVWKDVDIFFASWSDKGVNIILFAILLAYIIFLITRYLLKRKNKFIVSITIIEVVILSLFAVLLLLQQFNIFSAFGPTFIFGLIIYFRGLVNLLAPYFSSSSITNNRARMSALIAILLISIGAIMFVSKVPNDIINWFMSIVILLTGIALIILGILEKPEKNNSKKK